MIMFKLFEIIACIFLLAAVGTGIGVGVLYCIKYVIEYIANSIREK